MRLFSLPRKHIILLILLVLTNPLFYVMAKTIRPENFMLLGVGLAIYFYLKWQKTLQKLTQYVSFITKHSVL